jgi:hypothetical protein
MSLGRVSHATFYQFGFLLVLVVAWICYRPALDGAFQLDDIGNLADLAYVEDLDTAADFILAGEAGPLGRPIALLTFALQAEHWDENASAFLRFNVLLHLLNAILLAGCLYLLSAVRNVDRDKAILVAVAAASMWVILPLLASASLLVVQRMTTLSALFSLLGLGGYLLARRRIEDTPKSALVWMSLSLAGATLLAALCKETGLLLPTLVLSLEFTILGRPTAIGERRWRYWQAVFLLLPTLALIAYLVSVTGYPEWLALRRGFSAWERLLTESQLLWVYLYKALVGLPAHLGVYQTPVEVSRSLFEPLTLLASLAWVSLLSAAILWRRRFPLLALAVLWFLGGHLIESTVVPLELYFEHRNYLPMIGPLYALCAFLLSGATRLRNIAAVAIPAFIAISAYFLYSFASLSGEPSLASRYWAMQHPDSVRAVTRMATFQLSEEGPLQALSTIDRFVLRQPRYAYLRIQELNLRCRYMPAQDHGEVLAELQQGLPHVDFTYTAGTMLSELFNTVAATSCNAVDPVTVSKLAEQLRGNPRYANDRNYNQFHHRLLAGIARQQGDDTGAHEQLQRAMSQSRSSELNTMMVTLLAGAGEYDAASEFIDEAMQYAPRNLLRAAAWRRDLQKLRDYVDELERYSDSQERKKE